MAGRLFVIIRLNLYFCYWFTGHSFPVQVISILFTPSMTVSIHQRRFAFLDFFLISSRLFLRLYCFSVILPLPANILSLIFYIFLITLNSK